MALRMDIQGIKNGYPMDIFQSKTAVTANQTFPRPPTQKNHTDLVKILNKKQKQKQNNNKKKNPKKTPAEII